MSQEVQVIGVADLERIITEKTEKTRVINFWATWCKPCVEEMPYFNDVEEDARFDDVEIILVSVDFVENLDSRVNKFIRKKDIKSTVKLIDNVDYNSWIDKVDKSWTGTIPATLILSPDRTSRKFFQSAFTEGQLQEILLKTNF